jgi:hypothetical protein
MRLSDFGTLLEPTRHQLKQLDGLWREASRADREAFVEARRELLEQEGGRQLAFAHPAVTSGYTDGVPKQYTWGPNYGEMWRFNEWLKFHPHGIQRTIYVKLTRKEGPLYTKHVENLDFVAFNIHKLAEAAAGLTLFKATKNCLFILPSYLQFLLDAGFRLGDHIDPKRFLIYATGEPSPPALRQAYVAQGLTYIDAMRSWMGGFTFITCEFGERHVIDYLSAPRLDGTRLYATDLWNLSQPFVDIDTQDDIRWARRHHCACGRQIDDIEFEARNPVIVLNGRPWPYQELSGLVTSLCKGHGALLGRTFSWQGDHLRVQLVSETPLADREQIETRMAHFLDTPVAIEEEVNAGQFKIRAIASPS